MTSSLVGSEMCIRDRRRSRLAQCEYALEAASQQAGTNKPGFVACHTRAVSYTHLTLPTICSV
eukprot:1961810-Prorocentrum_lima.AAC.1